MKNVLSACAAVAALSTVAFVTAEPGVVYNDAANDIGAGLATANGTADILSVEVSHTASDVQFKLTLNGDVTTTDWAKFMIGISSPGAGIKTSSGNGWGRPINMSSGGGMNYWLGSWIDGGNGAESYVNGGSTWNRTGATWNGDFSGSISKAGSTVTLTVARSAIGMSADGTFLFDVYTSGGGGGDGALDALSVSTPAIANWGDTFTTTNGLSYAIPAPGAVALVGLAGLIARRRKA
jgi:hypothetical protein